MTDPVLEIRDLGVAFTTRSRTVAALRDLSCRIGPAEVLGLVGESGSGKSTVALAIMGALGPGGRVTAGSIRFQGREILGLPERALRSIRGRGIAMVGQEPMSALNPTMRIGAQLAEVPMLHGAPRAQALALARQALAEVDLPDPDRMLASWPHQLSGGQLQRIAIAMALLARPALLILDEPTTALDVTVEAGIVDLLKRLGRRHGMAALFISHNLGLVAGICDRLSVLYAGEVVESGPVAAMFHRPRHPYTNALLRALPRLDGPPRQPPEPLPGSQPLADDRPAGCSFAPRCAHARPGLCDHQPVPLTVTGDSALRCLRPLDRADTPAPTAPRPPPAPGRVVLRVEDLVKHHGGMANPAVAGVSFDARAGETLAIVGESGCGKSTLARMVMGLDGATGGRILLDGQDIQHLPVERRPAAAISALQMVFQNPSDTLNPARTVGAQVMRAVELFHPPQGRAERLASLFEQVRLSPALARRKPAQLSGGQRQRIGIARALAAEPRILVADEPVSALDTGVQAAVVALLLDLQRQRGATLIFISHDLALVRHLADRVMVMYRGLVMEIGPTEAVLAPPFHPYTQALLAAVPVPDPTVPRPRVPAAFGPEIPGGCPFQAGCPMREGRCASLPPLVTVAPGHLIRCHLTPGGD